MDFEDLAHITSHFGDILETVWYSHIAVFSPKYSTLGSEEITSLNSFQFT